jgi:hypothetical protein
MKRPSISGKLLPGVINLELNQVLQLIVRNAGNGLHSASIDEDGGRLVYLQRLPQVQ